MSSQEQTEVDQADDAPPPNPSPAEDRSPDDRPNDERIAQVSDRIDKARAQAEDAGVLVDEDEETFADSGVTETEDDQTIAPPG
jgi:hypothetical protein